MTPQSFRPVIYTTAPDSVGRLRLNGTILDAVAWLRDVKSSAPIDCVIRIGARQQLMLAPVRDMGDEEFPPGVNEEAAHYFAAYWNVRLSAEPTKRRREFTLPRELRLLKAAPQVDEPTVVFAFGDRLEIWRGQCWLEYVTELEKQQDTKRRSGED